MSISTKQIQGVSVGIWTRKFTLTYTQFSATATTFQVMFYSLQPNEYIHDSEIIPSTLFAGTGITTVRGTIGTLASVAAYTNTVPTAINLHTDSTSTPHQIRAGIQSTSVATDIGLNLVSVGANLDQLTQGVVDVWLYTSFLTP